MKFLLIALLGLLAFWATAQVVQPYVKPCMVQLSPTIWIDMNHVFSLGSTPDGTTVVVTFQDGKELRYVIPADQAGNYVRRALSTLEACKR